MLGRAAIAKPIKIGEVRELTQGELRKLTEKRKPQSIVARFRDSHHKLAWLFASGMRPEQIALASGYSMQRVYTLSSDPAFRELVEKKREKVDQNRAEVLDDFEELIKGNMLKAERMLADKLDDADETEELLPTRELIAISRDAADRLGYGKKATNVNVNIDFAAKLDRAVARSSKVIDNQPSTRVSVEATNHMAATRSAEDSVPPSSQHMDLSSTRWPLARVTDATPAGPPPLSLAGPAPRSATSPVEQAQPIRRRVMA